MTPVTAFPIVPSSLASSSLAKPIKVYREATNPPINRKCNDIWLNIVLYPNAKIKELVRETKLNVNRLRINR